MKEGNIKKLIERYKAAQTNLDDEKSLFESKKDPENSLHKWFEYANTSRVDAPENLNEELWASFEKKTRTNTSWLVATLAVAASLALILTLVISNSKKSSLDYAEKQALLEEARSMFQEDKTQILYEDELIQIYTTVEEQTKQ